jgi:flagellin
MGLSILNNIPSLVAQNQLAITNSDLKNTLFQLSSGSKINSGADDPAGLAIADGLQANISALTQSAQNVTDGVGQLQTADGALSQVTTLLNRAVTLAAEAANTGLTSAQQTALQNEFSSITAEINQIGSNTTYNNTPVFSGGQMSVFLSDGSAAASQDPTISVNMPTLSASSLGLASYATGTIDLTNNPTVGNSVQIGSTTYTFVSAGQASAADDVALGSTVQSTLQNLQAAVNGSSGSGSIYGSGTVANTAATITSVNGGSAVVQALSAGTAGNGVTLAVNVTSSVGSGGGTTLTGGTNATYDTGTLTLLTQPGLAQTATGSVTMSAQPDTAASATGVFALAANAANGATVTVGSQTYTFVTTGGTYTSNNDVLIGSGGSTQANIDTTLTNLAAAVNGTATAAQMAGSTGTDNAAGTAVAQAYTAGSSQVLLTASTPGAGNGTTSGNAVTFTSSIAGAANPGSGTAHLTGGANADTVTVGGNTYTFVAAGQAVTAGQVALGSTIQNTLTNLMNAVNDTGTASNTTYAAEAQANQTVHATGVSSNGTTLYLEAATSSGLAAPGSTGNSTVLTASSPVGAITVTGSGTLTGGTNNDTVTLGGVTYTFVAAGQAQTGNNDVALGSTVQNTLNNLMAAVNATTTTGGSASTYTLASAAMLQSAQTEGVSIASDTGGVATIQALTSGALSSGIDIGAVFQNGSSTGTLTGFNSTLSGGASGTAATGLIDMTSNAASGDTVTVGSVTYTFVAAGQATAGNEVVIGSTANATLTNLQSALGAGATGNGGGSSYYVSTLQGASGATITSISGNQATVTAATTGATGNSLALKANLTNGTAGSVSGGAAAAAATGYLALQSNPLNGNTVAIGSTTYTFTSATPTAADQVLLGSTIGATLSNLQEAVNGVAAGAGSVYGTGTVANTQAQITSITGNQALITAASTGANGNTIALSANLSNGAGGGTVGTVSSKLSGGGTSVDLNSSSDAETALTTIESAIATVAAQRGAIGSGINQMNAAVDVANNTSENLTSSLSGIQDANIGTVVANMSKFQVLEQTGIAALAQANSQEQAVLKLLG